MKLRILIYLILSSIAMTAFADSELRADYFRRVAASPKKSARQRCDAFYKLIKNDESALTDPVALAIARQLWQVRDYRRADSLLRKVATAKSNDPSWTLDLLVTKARTAFYLQNYADAMESTFDVIRMNKPDSLNYRNGDAYIVMADIFNVMGNFSLGEKCSRHAREIFSKETSYRRNGRETQSLICLSNALLGQKRIKDAFNAIRRARDLATDSINLNAIAGTLGLLYAMNGDPAMAETYYNEALEINGNQFNKGVQTLNLLGLKIGQGDYDAAEKIIDDNEYIFANLGNSNMFRGIHEARAYIFAHNGDYENAYNEMASALTAADSAHVEERGIYTDQLSTQFEERLANIEKSNSTRARIMPWIWALAAILLALLIFFGLRALGRRRDRECSGYQQRIDSLSERLSEVEKESKADLDEKNKRLVTMAMNLARVTENLNKISDLAADKKEDPDHRLKEINALLRQLSSEDNLWEMFKTYFEQVNQSFFNNLFAVQPNLTNAEIRMAAFILMNLTSKEIAILTSRSVRTVESIKYTLRKKLAITEPTEVFIRKIAVADSTTIEALRERNKVPSEA